MAAVVNSSIIDASLEFVILSDVNTTKHKPSSVDDAVRICGKLFSLPAISGFDPVYYFGVSRQCLRLNNFFKLAVFVDKVLLEIPFHFTVYNTVFTLLG